ncbi:MAG: glycosyltransferase [Armatimonadetes bacterium]|nr:glycosyltransferase [Armatimonadota bacterium]
MISINPNNTIFIILSFEGPDLYSQAGGLGVRITELSNSLAENGYITHLFFIGDPYKVGEEKACKDKLILHRWCQWISQYHLGGVYQNELGKVWDYERSIPPYLLEYIIKPATFQGKLVVILAEEWHTASTVINLNSLLKQNNLREKVIIFWNANNIFSFWRIPWNELTSSASITTISRYMKHYMWNFELNPLIIPNGISPRFLKKVDLKKVEKLKEIIRSKKLLVKVGRYDPDKRWLMAVHSIYELKKQNYQPFLIMHGGVESHRIEVLNYAKNLNLKIKEFSLNPFSFEKFLELINKHKEADVLELISHIPEEILHLLFNAAEAVLANSGHEPFGLVGLETMGAKGIAFTGCTGEDYARNFENAIVLETDNYREISAYLLELEKNPHWKEEIRKNAYQTAKNYTWDKILQKLIHKLEFVYSLSDRIPPPRNVRSG